MVKKLKFFVKYKFFFKKSLQNKKKQYLCALKLEIDYWQLNIQYSIYNNQSKIADTFFDILEDKVVQGKKCTCQFGSGLSSKQ